MWVATSIVGRHEPLLRRRVRGAMAILATMWNSFTQRQLDDEWKHSRIRMVESCRRMQGITCHSEKLLIFFLLNYESQASQHISCIVGIIKSSCEDSNAKLSFWFPVSQLHRCNAQSNQWRHYVYTRLRWRIDNAEISLKLVLATFSVYKFVRRNFLTVMLN